MQITRGRIEGAQKVLLYGVEGIGKSTLAAQFADPLFIDTEGSTKHMDVKRLDAPQSWTMLLEEVRFVILNPTSCRTLVIDTVDWAESLCISHVCAVHQWHGIEEPGYGKGYVYLAEEFGNLLNLLTDVVERGVNVVTTAHSTIKKFEQPDEAAAYDRWGLKLEKKTGPMLREWADMVLFANYKTFAVKSEATKTAKAAGGKRTLFSTHMPAWDAKNRHDLPAEMPFEDGKGNPIMPPELLAVVPAIAITESTAPEAAPAVVPVETPAVPAEAPSVPVETSVVPSEPLDRLKPLYALMEEAGVAESDIQAIVAAKGYFPLATPIEKYPQDFVDGVLVAAWTQVLAGIKDTIPFK